MHNSLHKLTAFGIFLLSILAHNFACATPSEAQFFEKVAFNYVNAHFKNLPADEKVKIEVDRVDPKRNFNGRCEGFLTAEIIGGTLKANSTVKISCSDPSNTYTLYVPVKITSLKARIVASRDIARGEVVGPHDYSSEFIENTRLSTGVITNPKQLEGVRVKRDLKQGDFFVLSNICTVCKGDRVTIEATNGSLSLKTSGEAVEDGNVNDTIQVRNLKTRKIIPGIVTGPGIVSILLD